MPDELRDAADRAPDAGPAPAPGAGAFEDPDRSPATAGVDADDQVRRLRRIEGQVRGLQRMVEQGSSCLDVLTQISAVTRALQAVALAQLDEHLRSGVLAAAQASPQAAASGLDEVSAAIARLVRS